MKKEHILSEIRRTAALNDGTPLGKGRFLAETGIKESDWAGKFWVRWGDAIREAGFEPQKMQEALPDDLLLEKLATFVRELGHYPVEMELRIKDRQDPSFPNPKTFRRFGGKGAIAARLLQFCQTHDGYQDVIATCASVEGSGDQDSGAKDDAVETVGVVYLIRSGSYYKIGRTNALGRRERELAIQLPEKVRVVHEIRTDDPSGIEDYWHRRFADRRKNGEWFDLAPADVAAFRRRKFM